MIHPEENLENGNPKCYICIDDTVPLYKICSCADSFLCMECLNLTEERLNDRKNDNQNRFKCHICRQNLHLENICNSVYVYHLGKHLLIRALFIMVDFIPVLIIHKYVKTEYPTIFFTTADQFIYLSILNILFFRNSFKFLLSLLYKIEEHRITFFYGIDVMLSILTICLFCFSFIHSSFKMVDLYAGLVFIFNYQFFFLIVWLMCVLDKLGKFILELKKKYQNYRILVSSSYFPTMIANPQDV